MLGIDTLFLLIGPFVVPFLVGWKVESTKRGLIPLMVIPVLFGAGSVFAFFFGSEMVNGVRNPYQVLTAVLFAASAVYLTVVFTVCWFMGRAFRRRNESTAAPSKSPTSQRSSNTPAIDARVGVPPLDPSSVRPVDVSVPDGA